MPTLFKSISHKVKRLSQSVMQLEIPKEDVKTENLI